MQINSNQCSALYSHGAIGSKAQQQNGTWSTLEATQALISLWEERKRLEQLDND